MTTFDGETSSEAKQTRPAQPGEQGRVSFLDQALWKQFSEATTPEAFLQLWLGLQCRVIGGVNRSVVVMGEPDEGPFAPAVYWPDEGVSNEGLSSVAELALAERRGVLQSADGDGSVATSDLVHAAYPFIVDNRIFGVVAIEMDSRPRDQLRSVMRQLQWGVGWVEVILRREQVEAEQAQLNRTAVALDIVAAALERDRFQAACNATVTELAVRLGCDQVSIGFIKRRRARIAAVSHAAQFGGRMNLIRDIGTAMDEAIDQRAIVLYPRRNDWEFRITRAHSELAQAHGTGSILTVPLYCDGRFFGAMTFERPSGTEFSPEDVDLCDCVASVVGPILDEKRRNDRFVIWILCVSIWRQLKRLLGPHYFGRKLATALGIAVVAFFAVAEGEYKVTAPAALEGVIQRAIVAPFDGYIATQHARAGEVVKKGAVLATLDDQDLVLERLRWSAKHRERLTEYDRARAERQRAEAKITQAQIEEAVAQIALLNAQLLHTKLRAPFDGLIISGDLSQSVGAAVPRGEELFLIAPLNSYRVILEVDESDISDVRVGQRGSLLVSSIPDEGKSYVVQRITPISEAREGRNFFRVEARLEMADLTLRPGMRGISKTSVDDRLLVWIWTDKLIDWARLAIWKWLP